MLAYAHMLTYAHVCFKVPMAGIPWTWGGGYYWCLGHGSHVDEKYPRMVRALKNKGIVQVAAGM